MFSDFKYLAWWQMAIVGLWVAALTVIIITIIVIALTKVTPDDLEGDDEA